MHASRLLKMVAIVRRKLMGGTAATFLLASALPFMLSVCASVPDKDQKSASNNSQAAETVERRGAAVRAFYRWKVTAGEEENFIKAYGEATRATKARFNGSRGSILLRNRNDPSEFLVVARWMSRKEWLDFQQSEGPEAKAARTMSGGARLIHTEAFDEIEDLIDYSSWKTKMIRIYRLKIKQGEENAFITTWQRVSKAINARHKGARGALLMQDAKDRSMFTEIVRWDSLEDWQRFIAAEPIDPQAFKTLFELMTLQSTEVMEEVENLLDAKS